MAAKVRDRIVNFRLSQDEYRILQEASEARGARNISDFTRSEVLAFLMSRLHRVRVLQRRPDEANSARFEFGRRGAAEDRDAATLGQEPLHQATAEKPGAAGDERGRGVHESSAR